MAAQQNDLEKYFRALRNEPKYWNEKEKCLSSAAFKDNNGVSVEKNCERNLQKIIICMTSYLCCDYLYSVSANVCSGLDVFINQEPRYPGEIYHHSIYKNSICEKLTSSQSRNLAKAAYREYEGITAGCYY